ncbi:acylphosphatase [Roseivirga pacifica]|uniref:Acylphosphatase n=1 Tax=Roseivirga pacifica TaxID=1267423 RepID=A0A1I0NI58_9BACT|nr:acylphosphatase [Roseivirga pacifica]RKQ51201.1 acylphosphatase [Roseivirga pacifica]SEW00867.1 acylphosphatase [Roseivirga pacifica]
MKAVKIQVYGVVQGVFFRASTKQAADRLGLKGWCRNEPDGSVLIEAVGNKEQLEQFEAWCNEGPEMARVDKLLKTEVEVEEFPDFEIRR